MTDLRRGVLVLSVCALFGGFGAIGACDCNGAPGQTYYQRNIEPILIDKCAGNTSGCHSTNIGDVYKFAAGNFDVTSFDNVQKRRDVLTRFGPYPQPLLLIKAIAPETPDPMKANRLSFQYGQDLVTDPTGNTPAFRDIEVLHAGGSVLQLNSDAYFTLQTWLENGATENGLKPPTPAQTGNGTCSPAIPSGFSATPFMTNPNYAAGLQKFKDEVQPILKDHGCTSSNCHGAPQSDFYITCGDTDDQLAFNFTQAWSFVNNPVDDSQILRVPLAVSGGGRGHTGGDQFSDTNDGDYTAIKDWATMVGLLDFANGDPVKQYFKDNVQPILIARGCQFQACHSPQAFNDFKLRSGTQGFFSAVALEKNYELLKNEFMAMEFPDARRGRAIAKAVLTDDLRTNTVGGIQHRAGSVLETPGFPSDPAGSLVPPGFPACTTAPASTGPFCIIQKWVDLERAAMGTSVSSMNQNDQLPLVYVERPAGQQAGRLEFDTFQGGADLRKITATFGANYGRQLTIDNATQASLLGGCAGLTAGTADIGRPSIKNDGDTVAFAGRPNSGSPWRIYTVSITTGTCAQVNTGTSGTAHDFDPTWSPDGQYIVFASTRGKSGVVETRVQPRPQSDIWRIQVPSGTAEQVTVLSNSEINPQFMREGRMTMSTEKASDGFYQVSGRRINWDLTDYHPLLAQRKDSPYPTPTDLTNTNPSIGFSQATDIREGADGNFLLILSDSDNGVPVLKGGAGALAIFNRSIGPFEQGRTDPGYLPSVRIIGMAGASGHTGATSGYRYPSTLPDGQILVSYATLPGLDWDLVVVDPRTGGQQTLAINTAKSVSDAQLAYKYPARSEYLNRRQLVFGGGQDMSDAGHAILYMPDAPMVFTVLTGNLRRGRPVDAFRKAKYLAVYTEGMCPAGACSRGANGIFESRMMLGKAPLADDGSVKVRLPAQTGVILELQDDSGTSVVKMKEEHQLGPGEHISMGVNQTFTNTAGKSVNMFDAVCGGCHGSVSGEELDVLVTADALTGASASESQADSPTDIGN